MTIAETLTASRMTSPCGDGETEATLTTPSGEMIIAYVHIYRDAATGEIIAADPRIKDAHGRPVPTFEQHLRATRRSMRNGRDHSGEVLLP